MFMKFLVALTLIIPSTALFSDQQTGHQPSTQRYLELLASAELWNAFSTGDFVESVSLLDHRPSEGDDIPNEYDYAVISKNHIAHFTVFSIQNEEETRLSILHLEGGKKQKSNGAVTALPPLAESLHLLQAAITHPDVTKNLQHLEIYSIENTTPSSNGIAVKVSTEHHYVTVSLVRESPPKGTAGPATYRVLGVSSAKSLHRCGCSVGD